MSCVNTSHKEFIQLSKDLNINERDLEMLVYEFQNSSPDNEGKFPSREYIVTKLTGENNVNGPNQIELWNRKYSEDRTFMSEKELETAKHRAKQFFPSKSITTWTTREGKFKMRVAKPEIEKERYEKELQKILENAPRDINGKLLAPNDKPSNLTERQYAQVRTKSFKKWFGDWENDPENASKVVDENGEPLVVYHQSTATGFNVFNLNESVKSKDTLNSYSFHFGTKQAASEVETYGNKGDLFEVFLNIKNPVTTLLDDTQAYANSTLTSFHGFFAEERFGKKLSDDLFDKARSIVNDYDTTPEEKREVMEEVFNFMGFDGVKYKNEIEDAGSISYAALNPNQIKSAEENIGTFSEEDNNIYYNRLVGDVLEALRNTKWVEQYSRTEYTRGAIHKIHGTYRVTLGRSFKDEVSPNMIVEHVKWILINQGIPVDAFNVEPFGTHSKEVKISLKEDILPKEKFAQSIKESKETKENILKMHSFLKERIPSLKDIHFISRKEALNMGLSNNTNAFNKDGEVFIVLGRGNLQITAEECLHPLLNYVQEVNPKLFESLLEEAKKAFPTLYAEISLAYKKESQKTRDNELVTQAVARYFAEDFINTDETKSFADKAKQLFDFLADFFNSLFTKNHLIDAKELPNISLKELAQLLNTSDSTWLSKVSKDIQENKEEKGVEEVFRKTTEQKRQELTGEIFVPYTPKGKEKQQYTVINNKIYNSDGKEVFEEDSVDRTKILANAAVKTKNAVVIPYGEDKYVVYKDGTIVSGISGKILKWPENHGIRKALIKAATIQEKFTAAENNHKESVDYDTTTTDNSSILEEEAVPIPPINVWYGSRENAILSNMANRPFDLTDTTNNNSIIKELSKLLDKEGNLIEDLGFNNVEAAFQAAKILFTSPGIYWNITSTGEKMLTKEGDKILMQLMTENGTTAKSIGNSLKGLNSSEWDNHSYSVMKDLIKISFESEYNTEALQALLATGEAPITHTQENIKSRWREDFPKALMEVRKELANKMQADLTARREEKSQKYIVESVKLADQISTLLNGGSINPTEAREIADNIVFWISDEITKIQENPKKFLDSAKYAAITKDNINLLKTCSRQEVITIIGFDNLLSACKTVLTNTIGQVNSLRARQQANSILKCWDGLLNLASSTFADVERLGINRIGENIEIIKDVNSTSDDFAAIQEEDNLEEIGNKQEHWQVEFRTLDVLNTMSQKVRLVLNNCYVLDNNGEKVINRFGIAQRVSPREATNSILAWSQGATTLKEIIEKLKNKEQENPWIRQIINKLEDRSDSAAEFKSQFFSVFYKHFQNYYVVVKENEKGKVLYKSIPINSHPALKDVMKAITAMYTMGSHPLFLGNGQINKHSLEDLKDVYKEFTELDVTKEDNKEDTVNKIAFMYSVLGYNAPKELIEKILTNKEDIRSIHTNLKYLISKLTDNISNKDYNPLVSGMGDIRGNLRGIFSPVTNLIEEVTTSSFYDSEKMYQSYVIPSYMTKLMTKFRNPNKESFDRFIANEYGKYEWFNDGYYSIDINKGWRCPWLQKFMNSVDSQEVFQHKVQLSFNNRNYMKNLNDVEYALSLLTEYFSESDSSFKTPVAWFRIPMLSNKPSSEFVRFYCEKDENTYRNNLTTGFLRITEQELSRIQTVRLRGYNSSDPEYISSFDKNGKSFVFMDFLNKYLDRDKKSSELGKLLNKKVEGKKLTSDQLAKLEELLKTEIANHIEDKAEKVYEEWLKNGVVEGARKIKGIGNNDAKIKESIINFVWNDTFATMNILELTITDPAFYKNAEDLQKRLAQIHAPGIRGNVDIEYKGEKITDGFHRTIYLKDWDKVQSNIIENVKIVFDRKIDSVPDDQKGPIEALRNNIIKQFKEINVTDAQAFSSPTSYRKKALVFGKWNDEYEEIYQRLIKGQASLSDVKKAFQPLKPFVYSQISKDSGVEGPIKTIKEPVQYKNSEYLLIMAGALLQGEDTGRPNLLRVIFDIMEESAKENPSRGIDTVQFESAVKSGLQGALDIQQFQNHANAKEGEKLAKDLLKSSIYKEGIYNQTFVHEVPYEDYSIQQEVPGHFIDHEQAHGSQVRAITISDLDSGTKDNPVYYEVDGKKVTASEFKNIYEQTIADNIEEDIKLLEIILKLDGTQKEKNIAISQMLTREIINNPRYGVDLLYACSLDADGNFRIPLGDPIQSKRIEQLINSIIKNTINKQEIPGGPLVQVSNFGTSKELNIKFKSKSGEFLMNRSEWEKSKDTKYSSYEEYIKSEQGGIAYFECYAPAPTSEIFEKFQNPDGTIDIKSIEEYNPELLKMVGYRIPTEDKYSCVPLKIVGFLPKEAGEGIMLPNDITLLSGSDFDVDKLYVMRKHLPITTHKKEDIANKLYDRLISSKENPSIEFKRELSEKINMFLSNPYKMRYLDPLYKHMWKIYKHVAYKPAELTRRDIRDNRIVDMTFEVLTHESTASQLLNPGGFEDQKRVGYAIEAYRNPEVSSKYSLKELLSMSVEELKDKCYTTKNLSYIDTQIQFYKQNSAASSLIGTFAVHKTAHAILEGEGYQLNLTKILDSESEFFTIDDYRFENSLNIDATYMRDSSEFIGKVLGSLVASAADAVKDPVLNLMNINSITAPILNTLIRCGIPFETAALFLSQKCIVELLQEQGSRSISQSISINSLISEKLKELEKDTDIVSLKEDKNKFNKLSKEALIKGINNSSTEHTYAVLKTFNKLSKISKHLKSVTFVTRFNSISSAVGPQIIDNLIIEEKLFNFTECLFKNGMPVSETDIFNSHPILKQFYRTVDVAERVFEDMPINSSNFRYILNSLPNSTKKLLYANRKNLNKFADFYLSHLLVSGNVIDSNQLKYYIEEFPKKFVDNYKKSEKYFDNLLIRAINYEVDKNTGRVILKANITNLDIKEKEMLGSAWNELYNNKDTKELALDLFKYCFFKGGAGFSPKTFMSLLPVFMREQIDNYKEAFNNVPKTTPFSVIDQFIGNNHNDHSLVPVKTIGRDFKADHKPEKNTLVIRQKTDVRIMSNVPYFKDSKTGIVYKQLDDGSEQKKTKLVYFEIPKLGNNGEYLEISSRYIKRGSALTFNNNTGEELEIVDYSKMDVPTEADEDITPEVANISKEQDLKDELVEYLMIRSNRFKSKEDALKYIEDFRAKKAAEKALAKNGIKKFLAGVIKEKTGMEANEKKIEEFCNMLCN